jgi:uncharacterized OB-fold protein
MSQVLTRPLTAASFKQFLNEKKLMGARCTECSSIYLPPREICPKCHSDALDWQEFNGRGKLAAFTSIYIGPSRMIAAGFDRNNPYCTGIVELDEGVKISARILGVDAKRPKTIQIGTPLTIEFVQSAEGAGLTTELAFKA